MSAHGLVGQIEHLEDDVHATDATSELERIDAVVDEGLSRHANGFVPALGEKVDRVLALE